MMELNVEPDAFGVEFVRQLEQDRKNIEGKMDEIRMLAQDLTRKLSLLAVHHENLKNLAVTDGLTGLHNYRYFQECLRGEVNKALRYKRYLSLLLLDIDHFKRYNDSRGHVAGDTLLRQVACILKATVRSSDLVARYGGEEFVVVLPETSKAQAGSVVRKILTQVREATAVTVSGGLAAFPTDALDTQDLIRAADQRLYAAKAQGRDRIVDEDAPADPAVMFHRRALA